MSKKPKMKEIARLAGVSVGTVSNVINQPEKVSEATRNRVISILQKENYVSNAAARQLRVGQQKALGLICYDLMNPFFAIAAQEMSREAERKGYILIIMCTDSSPTREEKAVRQLIQYGVSGVVVTTAGDGITGCQDFEFLNIPIYLFAQSVKSERIGSISVNDAEAMYKLGLEFVRQNVKKVLFINGSDGVSQHILRRKGLMRAFSEESAKNVSITEVIVELPNAENAYRALEDFVTNHGYVPDAIIGINDYTASGVARFLNEHYSSSRGKFLVGGFDNVCAEEFTGIPFITVRQPVRDMSRRVVDSILKQIESKQIKTPNHILLDSPLITYNL